MNKNDYNFTDTMKYNIDRLTDTTSKYLSGPVKVTAYIKRLDTQPYADASTISDVFTEEDAVCHFIRFSASSATHAISFIGSYNLSSAQCGGWIIYPTANKGNIYWVPVRPCIRQTDGIGHILNEGFPSINGVNIENNAFTVEFASAKNKFTDITIWKFSSNCYEWIKRLNKPTSIDVSGYYTWGSHTNINKPADIYLHICYGQIYENRKLWPKFWKIYSENDAHSLFVIFNGLEKSTLNTIYTLLKHQLIISVISRQADDGGWHHGEWTDDMESHFRLHCSAMHLLMDAYEEYRNEEILTSLKHAAYFISKQKDKLYSGDWYLHDELETSIEMLNKGPFRWLLSRAFGKSPSNMLVLNTQLDTIIALDRYREITGDHQYSDSIMSACNATKIVLQAKPAEWLYRPLFSAINLTLLPTRTAEQLSMPLRGIKRLTWKYLIPLLPYIKRIFPRIVMPGGYIDRELSLKIWAHEYMSINLVDILRYSRRFPAPYLDELIDSGITFVHKNRLYERWLEQKGKEYSIGFWCEALYHACLLYDSDQYRIWLADSMLLLIKNGFGLPPSLLGANSEAVPMGQQHPCPVLSNKDLRIANLDHGATHEYIIVNPNLADVTVDFPHNRPSSIEWINNDGEKLYSHGEVLIPGNGWCIGTFATDSTGEH